MLDIGTQTKNVIVDDNPKEGFEMLKRAGFSCCDFSLNAYLKNTLLYEYRLNNFFDQTEAKLEAFFAPHRKAAQSAGIAIHQIHMPYPIYIPKADREINDYLWKQVAPKSMSVCHYLGCRYIVVHGFKLAHFLGNEELEWKETEKFIESIAPTAKEMGITVCIENLYDSIGNHMVEGPCCDVRKVIQRIDCFNDKYGAEVLGFCFDTGHANIVGIDFESFITALGSRLKIFHIHDNDGISDLHQLPFTFTRTRENMPSTDWEGFIRGLRAIRFNGVLSFETAPVLSAFPDELKEKVLCFIAEIGRYFADKVSDCAMSTESGANITQGGTRRGGK